MLYDFKGINYVYLIMYAYEFRCIWTSILILDGLFNKEDNII